MTHYPQPLAALVRLYRYLRNRCLVCGCFGVDKPYRYCSFECSCYDGVSSVRFKPLTDLPKSRILCGKTTETYKASRHWG
jgi:hypothetical protein